jgi:DNA-binding beta-propeller fold protein YncE
MGTLAYVTNNTANTVSVCPINANGTLGTCTTSDPGNTFHGPAGISLNQASTFAYISNSINVGGNRNISVCPLNGDGSLGTCTEFISPLFNFGNFGKISINSAATFLYVVNEGNNYISLCSLNSNGGITSCLQLTPPNTTFNSPEGIIIG